MRRRLAGVLLALPLLAALALAGCGESDGGDGIASATGEDAEAAEEPDGGESPEEMSEEERYEAQLAFARCMREHGVDINDPVQGEPPRIQVRGDPAQIEEAQAACEDLLPAGGPGGGANNPEVEAMMLEFAQCMRDNGVESFPDPQPGQGVRIGPEVAEDPDFEAAQETCGESVLGGMPPGQGSSPRGATDGGGA